MELGNYEVTLFTTFNKKGYDEYGRNMLASFKNNLPKDTCLLCYVDGFKAENHEGVFFKDLHKSSANINDFKRKFSQFEKANGILRSQEGRVEYNYNYDAIKFCHKVFCITHALMNVNTRYAFWIDGDTVCKKEIPEGFFQSFLSNGEYICYLGRIHMYSECGFIGFDTHNPVNQHFVTVYEDIFNTGDVFVLSAWHDCVAFDEVRNVFEREGFITSNNISGIHSNTMHPFVNSILGNYMDHLKGPRRKKAGHSFQEDYVRSQV